MLPVVFLTQGWAWLLTVVVAAGAQAIPKAATLTPTPQSLPVVTADGKAVDIAAAPGWRVVTFWSAECPCVRACERYSLGPLARKYQGRVSFFAVVSGGYDLALPNGSLAKEIQARRLPYPVLLDSDHAVAKALGAKVTPETFLIDPSGRVVFAGMPDDSRRYLTVKKGEVVPGGVHKTYLSEALAQALAGKPVAHPTNPLEGCIISY